MVVDLTRYDPVADGSCFSELLSRDVEHYPVFLPNGLVDMKLVSDKRGELRVATSANRRYVKSLRISDRNRTQTLFNIYRLRGSVSEFLLIYKEYPIYIKIEVKPREIRKSYLYEDGKNRTSTYYLRAEA